MNRYRFAARNMMDKAAKSLGSWETTRFYFNAYIRSKLKAPTPNAYIVSYPKCGRTWLRIMLQHYYRLLQVDVTPFIDPSLLQTDQQQIVRFDHDQGNWVPAPRSYKTFRFNTAKFTNYPVIFLIRHPGDVLVSSWYHLKYRENIYPGNLSQFIREELTGIRKVVEFMNMWLEHQNVPQPFLLISYETMKASPEASLRRVLEVLQNQPSDANIQKAVEAASFKNMKQMENSGSLKEPWMRPGNKQSNHSMKIRSGKSGGFRDEMSKEDVKLIQSTIEQYGHPELKALYL